MWGKYSPYTITTGGYTVYMNFTHLINVCPLIVFGCSWQYPQIVDTFSSTSPMDFYRMLHDPGLALVALQRLAAPGAPQTGSPAARARTARWTQAGALVASLETSTSTFQGLPWASGRTAGGVKPSLIGRFLPWFWHFGGGILVAHQS